MYGPQLVARTLSTPVLFKKTGEHWQYHPRSDRHSKAACWGLLFDLLLKSETLRSHAESGRVAFGINHEMRDFRQNRKKNLDLVLCTPAEGKRTKRTFADLVEPYAIELNAEERRSLAALPPLHQAPVGSVRVALEAKACMTAHGKALPRLFDELNSSHLTVHGASENVIAAGFVMVNFAKTFASPGRVGLCPHCHKRVAPVNEHDQPRDAERVIAKIRELPRRAKIKEDGFDAMCVVGVDCANDGSPVSLVTEPPAPGPRDIFHYDQMVIRLAELYESRFERA